jgi:pyruvate formate lyase activating enzyme
MTEFISTDTVKTQYWHSLDDGRVQCDLCPRYCKLHPSQRGLCFVRQNLDNQIVLTSYGRSSGFAIDPIEKKPFFLLAPPVATWPASFARTGTSASHGKWTR